MGPVRSGFSNLLINEGGFSLYGRLCWVGPFLHHNQQLNFESSMHQPTSNFENDSVLLQFLNRPQKFIVLFFNQFSISESILILENLLSKAYLQDEENSIETEKYSHCKISFCNRLANLIDACWLIVQQNTNSLGEQYIIEFDSQFVTFDSFTFPEKENLQWSRLSPRPNVSSINLPQELAESIFKKRSPADWKSIIYELAVSNVINPSNNDLEAESYLQEMRNTFLIVLNGCHAIYENT